MVYFCCFISWKGTRHFSVTYNKDDSVLSSDTWFSQAPGTWQRRDIYIPSRGKIQALKYAPSFLVSRTTVSSSGLPEVQMLFFPQRENGGCICVWEMGARKGIIDSWFSFLAVIQLIVQKQLGLIIASLMTWHKTSHDRNHSLLNLSFLSQFSGESIFNEQNRMFLS